MQFDLIPLRLDFTARDVLHFPPGRSANILRGAFGLALQSVGDAQYAQLFEPHSEGVGPSGLGDRPRPFVFRTRHLDGATFRPGDDFHFQLNLFTLDPAARAAVIAAFAEAGHEGFGPGRGRAMLCGSSGEPISLDLARRAAAVERVRVEFLSPTELKHEQGIVDRPEFAVLFARCRDRVATLRALYGAGPLEIDFAGMGARAAGVRLTGCELRKIEVERRSSRTGQSHSIGGFCGVAEYAGPLAEFLPFLEAAGWTGVGRQAVWGKGEISISCA